MPLRRAPDQVPGPPDFGLRYAVPAIVVLRQFFTLFAFDDWRSIAVILDRSTLVIIDLNDFNVRVVSSLIPSGLVTNSILLC